MGDQMRRFGSETPDPSSAPDNQFLEFQTMDIPFILISIRRLTQYNLGSPTGLPAAERARGNRRRRARRARRAGAGLPATL